MRKICSALLVGAAIMSAPLHAQSSAPRSIVSIYRAAPGQQLALLKWIARQDEIAKAAGQPASQLYIHQDGASWDYVYIQPAPTPEQDKAFDAAAKKMGVDPGPKMGLELRQYIAEHSDTISVGPTTAADYLKQVGN
ncbi:hypothetical protein ACFB49_12490 [Sphingomonas sp. DBB INV C78]|uniref:hypothetical protein n=1 Tax=Sphingomonas sp. DBB INV C78 TaxID=3349434 RepID=UPI0036D2BE23